ncbi:zinc finger protein 704 isoform X2 [Monomorium pharaonis]|uniref:zinc finger protein 704 isoform X2 n=1 Tax=Monomorium pharaonis TaxID=307658 RepID=UPI00174601F7|nr:zinc finger protein 704 isoform X2 [Monomorium pharaonis]
MSKRSVSRAAPPPPPQPRFSLSRAGVDTLVSPITKCIERGIGGACVRASERTHAAVKPEVAEVTWIAGELRNWFPPGDRYRSRAPRLSPPPPPPQLALLLHHTPPSQRVCTRRKIARSRGESLGTMSLTKRIDEIRLLESRKSARLADQDTDFARLADMAGDRKRASSHSIDVPHVMASRKRRPSSNNDSERTYSGWGERVLCGREGCRTNERGDCMDECAAALVLMSLSCSPHSPHNPPPLHCQYNYGSWGSRGGGGSGMIAGSPGVGGMSNSSSSSGASWRSGTPSPPLSEEGVPTRSSPCPATSHPSHNQPHYPYNASGSSSSSTPGSTTLDEGIVPDYIEEQHPRKKIRAKVNQDPIETEPGACATFESEQANAAVVFKCTWPGCLEIKATVALIEEHVRQSHLGPKKSKGCDSEDDMSVHEEEFYYQEVAVDHMSSPPTMSHRDMARPPHEDPEYQKQLRLEATPAANNYIENVIVGVREPSNTFTISQSPGTPNKHIKLSPRPLQACHQQNMTASTGKPSSPRRTRSDVKKCRKIYGMDSRDLWCTQCRWKKACTRFCSE